MNKKINKGFTLLESMLTLSLTAGAGYTIMLTGDEVAQAIDQHNQVKCLEAVQLMHQFPQLKPNEKFMEICK